MIIHKNQVFDMYQACNYNVSAMAEQREKSGIEKMLVTAGIQADKIAAEGKTEDGTTEYEQQSQHLSHMV